MRTDVKLLQTYNLMDYSLLMCIQENPDYMPVLREFRDNNRSMDSSRMSANSDARKISVTSNSPEMATLRQRF